MKLYIYSEQAKIEMRKYLIELAVKLLKDGYYIDSKDGERAERLEFSMDNLEIVYKELEMSVGRAVILY